MAFSVSSKWPGRCSKCGQSYPVGTQVTKFDNGKWGHSRCPNDQDTHTVYAGAVKNSKSTALQGGTIVMDSEVAIQHAPIAQKEPEPVQEIKPFTPSKYQQAIFEWIVFGDGHAVVEACAGSGKTSTSVQAVRYLPLSVAFHKKEIGEKEARAIFEASDPVRLKSFDYLMEGLDVGFFAFNKHIAAELKTRLPKWCYSATLHSLGYKDLRDALGKVDVDEDRRWEFLFGPYSDLCVTEETRRLPKEERAKLYNRRRTFKNLAALSKATLTDANNRSQVLALIAHYGLDLEENQDYFLQILPRVLDSAKDHTNLIDYDDMQWLPIVLGLPMKQFDYLFVDESQDLSDNQAEFVLRSVKPNGRIVAVGDTFQSLYGFRGAGVDSMQKLVATLNAQTLPLSITYRCPTSHVKLAKEIVPQIEARENAPEGIIEDTTISKMQGLITRGDMVICRTNAPLVPVAFGLIRKGIKAVIRGKDIGKNLSDLAANLSAGCVDMESFFFRLGDYSNREMTRMENRRASETQIQALQDKIDTLEAVAQECDQPDQIVPRIDSIFSDENGEIVLSSVHRAKGLESNTVWILRPDLMPFAKAKQPWEVQQERNIIYVAYTRSRNALYFVKD